MTTRHCPNCGKEIELLAGEFSVEYVGHDSVRVDGKAYCEDCDDYYDGSFLFDISGDEVDSWMWDF